MKIIFVSFLLFGFAAEAMEFAGPKISCHGSQVVDPMRLGCGNQSIQYCRYENVSCYSVPRMNMNVMDPNVAGGDLFNASPVGKGMGARLNVFCEAKDDGHCPSAAECANAKLSDRAQKLIQALIAKGETAKSLDSTFEAGGVE